VFVTQPHCGLKRVIGSCKNVHCSIIVFSFYKKQVIKIFFEFKVKYKCMNIVYGMKCNVNKKFYIGATGRTFHKRKSEHIRRLNKKEHHSRKLQRAWDKYGEESFEFIILEQNINQEMLAEREQYWINYHNSYNKGYNGREHATPCPVGEMNGMYGIVPHNKGKQCPNRKPIVSYDIITGEVEYFDYVAEVSKKYPHIGPQFLGCVTMKKIVKHNYSNLHNKFWFYLKDFDLNELKLRFITKNKPNPLLGQKRSNQIRENISKGRIGMKFSESHVKNMSLSRIGKNGKKIIRSDGKIFNSIKEAGYQTDCDPAQISHQLSGRTKTCKGYTFKYLE